MFVSELCMRDNTEKGSQEAALKEASAFLGSPSVALGPRCPTRSWTESDCLFAAWKLAWRALGGGVARWNSIAVHESTTRISYGEVHSTALRLEPQGEIKPMK